MNVTEAELPPYVEGQVEVMPGAQPGTAIRVRIVPDQASVRLEQLAHSDSAGWYVQKSFQIPAEMLPIVAQQLRKAHCLMPDNRALRLTERPILRLSPSVSADEPAEPTRRRA